MSMRAFRSVAGMVLCVASPSAVSVANAGVIRGVVKKPAVVAPPEVRPIAYPGRANALPGARSSPHAAITDAVVYVDGLAGPLARDLPRPGKAELIQQNQAFVPRVVPIVVGTSVTFPNRDVIYHNVFSLSPVRRFDLGKYPRGGSKSVLFDRAGLVKVYCDIHSNMEAFVLVLESAAFTRPNESGTFALPELPGGHYEVVVWHPDFGEARKQVALPAAGEARIELGF